MPRNWKNIHPNFTKELQAEWERHHFSYWETKEWIDIGLTPTDANFATWLRDNKNYQPEWVLNYGNAEQLRTEYLASKKQPSVYSSLKGYFFGAKPTSTNQATEIEEVSDQDTNSETSSETSHSSQETIKFNPYRTTLSEEEEFNDNTSKRTNWGTNTTSPPINFWDNNRNLLIIALLMVLAVIIYQTN